MIGLSGAYLFGSKVNEPVATAIRNSDGFIIDTQGNFVELLVLERGFTAVASAGKVTVVLGP